MGMVFYGSIAAAIGTGLFFKMQPEDGETSLTQKFRRWHAAYNETWDERNNLHAKLTEKAAVDKALFYDTRHVRTIPLRNAETFNSFAPWNQEVGWTQGNLEEVKAHYWAAHADRKNGSF
ncbi:hypothetical protein BJ508DRAFT_304537 [Ascobolus immersus RN42]|uniref:NADH-ubiquinone oxidoreductase 17.8 kDa subunit n=1 Tax=Ascobolus immersus RN42 TaxID=1160509 RepID=A0A3N4IC42_ASCIM|nr:hypothetical protein BJ508DRAFT_304537 [Ascobolus immersus RN42]